MLISDVPKSLRARQV